MEELLIVELLLDDKVCMVCSYVFLEPYAPTTERKFIFKDIQFKEIESIEYGSTVVLRIFYISDDGDKCEMSDLHVLISDYGDELEDEWWVEGLAHDKHDHGYGQATIDVLNMWQKGEVLDWFSLPINSPLRHGYFGAAVRYSGLKTEMMEKEIYQIDFSLMRDEKDFLYLVSMEFFGERGYFGWSIGMFEDCMLSIYDKHGYQYNKKVKFINSEKNSDPQILKLIEEVKKVFIDYKFSVEVVS